MCQCCVEATRACWIIRIAASSAEPKRTANGSTSTFFSGPFAAECGSLDPVDVSRQQIHLSAGFGAGSNRLNHPAVLEGNHGRILDPGRLATIFPRPESTRLFYLKHFTREGPDDVPHQFGALRRSITRQWNRMSPAYRTCCSLRHCLEAIVVKNGS